MNSESYSFKHDSRESNIGYLRAGGIFSRFLSKLVDSIFSFDIILQIHNILMFCDILPNDPDSSYLISTPGPLFLYPKYCNSTRGKNTIINPTRINHHSSTSLRSNLCRCSRGWRMVCMTYCRSYPCKAQWYRSRKGRCSPKRQRYHSLLSKWPPLCYRIEYSQESWIYSCQWCMRDDKCSMSEYCSIIF